MQNMLINCLLLSSSVVLSSVLLLAGAVWANTDENSHEPIQATAPIAMELPSKSVLSVASTQAQDLILFNSEIELEPGSPALYAQETTAPSDAEDTAPQAVETGTDPSKLIRRFEFNLQYIDAPNGGYTIAPVFRFDNPLSKSAGVAFEVPLSYTKVGIPSATGGTEFLDQFGLGDIQVRGRYVWNMDAVSVVAGLETVWPTATGNLLGTGKWQLNPTIAMVYRFSPEVLSALVYKHRFSVAGDGNRPEISSAEPRLIVAYTSLQGWWTLVDFQPKINLYTNSSIGLLEFEVGKMFSSNLGLSIRPGFQIWGNAERDFSLQIGSRYFF